MTKKYDIYITFPTQQINNDSKLYQIANAAVLRLQLAINRILKQQVTIAWKGGNSFNPSEYRKVIRESKLAVFFIHPEFELDTDYIRELEDICELMAFERADFIESYSKIFKISLEPSKKPLNPPCINDLLSYDFFEKNIYNRKIKSLDFDTSDKTSTVYSKLLDLAYDISSSLKIQNSEDDIRENKKPFVFLGLTTFDQQQARDDIKRELQHYGFRVLPFTTLPQTGEEFERALINNLDKADTVIQLMGSQYGEMLKGTKYSIPDYQNRIIREYQQKNENSGFNRFIWIPQNSKISDQRQALYLKRLRRDDATVNTEIIESPLETFKTILSAKLENSNHISRIEYENISKVYLLTEENELPEIEEIYSTLTLSGLKVYKLDYEEQVGIYARHLQALRDSDAVVIYQTSENQYWLNSKLRDIIKSPGIGRIKPFKKVVLVTSHTPDEDLIRMIKTRVELLNSNEAEPEQILQKIISE